MLSCIKYVVILYNFLFWLLGVAILGISILVYVDSQNYVAFDDTSELYMTPFLLLMALGALMTLVGFVGCCGAIREAPCVLVTYFLLCITMGVACGAAVWWSLENAAELQNNLQKDVSKVIREKYGQKPDGTTDSLVDKIQRDFQCCGIKSPNDWATSFYNSPNKNASKLDFGISGTVPPGPGGIYKVPASCCVKGYTECERVRSEVPIAMKTSEIQGLNTVGCWEKLTKYAEEHWKWLIVIAAVVIGVQLCAILLACCLCCAIGRSGDK